MIRYGFIHTKEDIKFLVLFAMDLLPFPVTFETVVDLITWCDDGFGYFELSEAFYEMIPTGHIDESIENGAKLYAITDKGREATRIFEKQLPYPVREAAQRSALRVVRQIRRSIPRSPSTASTTSPSAWRWSRCSLSKWRSSATNRRPCSSAPSKPTPKRSTRSCSAL